MEKSKEKLKKAAAILKEAREAKGYTQTQVAIEVGVGLRMYQKIENGEFPKYKNEQVKKIDKLLNTKLFQLLYEQKVHNKAQVNTINAETDANKSISYLYETIISQQAEINVLRVTVENLAADVKETSVSLVSGDMKKAINMEKDRLFDEFLKKQQGY